MPERAVSIRPQSPLIVLVTVILTTTTMVVASGLSYAQGTVVDRDVIVALEDFDGVNVVVMLTEPPAMQGGSANPVVVRREIARLQWEVLTTLAPSEFHLSIRYENVPAFVGRLFRRGVEKLRANPHVVRVGLDSGGGGAIANTNEEDGKK